MEIFSEFHFVHFCISFYSISVNFRVFCEFYLHRQIHFQRWICELWIMRRADKLMRYCCFHTSKLVSAVITLVWHCKWLWQHFEWYCAGKQCLQPFQCTLICIPAVLHLHSFQTGAKICLNTCFNFNLDNSVNIVIKISNKKKIISQNYKKNEIFHIKKTI